ncbi:PEP/pyruvate-binding domain-containing protein [Nocardiopsis alba]|uniref:PEP/pyruvate-binding domain-containing protein n=1 Tax=Nocardiopsis alba TaxID=53437 RepID=UPI0003793C26|nr:PEP/pyruvate-binding domain-containing protein [Nocardiopsis alba]
MNETSVTPLPNATLDTCGGKAATLGRLLREGLPVPEGFVVPFSAHRAARVDPGLRAPAELEHEVAEALTLLGDPPVAVRSSATNEDGAGASAAGQYESLLAVRGVAAVVEAIRDCWTSASSARVAAYRSRTGEEISRAEAEMGVLVQRLVDADVSGVMFTPTRPDGPTRIEASPGLGLAVVGGIVSPDTYEVAADGTVRSALGRKETRLDRDENRGGVVTRPVPEHQRSAPSLDESTAARLAALGRRVAELLDGPQDIEWAIADGTTWLLQARPITAPIPEAPASEPAPDNSSLNGTPGSHGVVTGTARVVRGPSDFGRVRAGDILVCPYTDPAWTPLFTVAGGVATETGGALSHAAIVAREYNLPAVIGVPHATTLVRDGATVTLDGTAGTLTPH